MSLRWLRAHQKRPKTGEKAFTGTRKFHIPSARDKTMVAPFSFFQNSILSSIFHLDSCSPSLSLSHWTSFCHWSWSFWKANAFKLKGTEREGAYRFLSTRLYLSVPATYLNLRLSKPYLKRIRENIQQIKRPDRQVRSGRHRRLLSSSISRRTTCSCLNPPRPGCSWQNLLILSAL